MAFLAADTAITALVSTRISPWSSQSDTLPRITYQRVTTTDEQTLSGSSNEPVARMTLGIWAATQTAARSLAKLVRNSRGGQSAPAPRLREFQGSMDGVKIQSCFLADEKDDDLPPVDGGGKPIPCVTQDWTIGFIEP